MECPSCKGRGCHPSIMDETDDCWLCKGTGKISRLTQILFKRRHWSWPYLDLIIEIPGLKMSTELMHYCMYTRGFTYVNLTIYTFGKIMKFRLYRPDCG